jgi:hypothetical protein
MAVLGQPNRRSKERPSVYKETDVNGCAKDKTILFIFEVLRWGLSRFRGF